MRRLARSIRIVKTALRVGVLPGFMLLVAGCKEATSPVAPLRKDVCTLGLCGPEWGLVDHGGGAFDVGFSNGPVYPFLGDHFPDPDQYRAIIDQIFKISCPWMSTELNFLIMNNRIQVWDPTQWFNNPSDPSKFWWGETTIPAGTTTGAGSYPIIRLNPKNFTNGDGGIELGKTLRHEITHWSAQDATQAGENRAITAETSCQ